MIGKRFGRYAIIGDVGSGGMGNVLRARDSVLGRDVALKLLHGGDDPESRDDSMREILREARAAAAIDHPNAVAIFDVGEIDGQAFLAMELVVGKTLRHVISEGDASLALRVAWLIDVANALAAAHRGGLLHRDIKPENVMVRDDGVVKVVDFGIARPLAAIDRDAATKSMRLDDVISGGAKSAPILTAGIRGTPGYMAPEQLRGEPLDGRADQFAWGILACELLTGEHPWPRADAIATVRAVTTEAAPSLRSRTRGVSEGLDRIVLRALEKRREARFGSMDELVNALRVEGDLAEEPDEKRGFFSIGRVLFGAAAIAMMATAFVPSAHPRPIAPRAIAKASAPYVAMPEAAASYREGIELVRDGSRSAAVAAFERAATIDPTYAAAHLRAAMFVDDPDSAMRTHLQVATQFRNGLSDYDRSLLLAFEPLANAPADWNESVRRLNELTSSYPDNAELWEALGDARVHAADNRGAIAAFERVALLDTKPALALNGIARIYMLENDTERARQTLESCMALSPASQSCLGSLIVFLRSEGRCEEQEIDARRFIALAPENTFGYRALANAIYSVHAETGRVRAALLEVARHASAENRVVTELAASTRLAVLLGDFVKADEYAVRWQDAVSSRPDEREHLSPAWYRMVIALETGRHEAAVALARWYLSSRSGWIPNDFAVNPAMFVLDVLHRSGGIDKKEFQRRRVGWLIDERSRELKTGDGHPLFAWMLGYAEPATTREDAYEAIRELPKFGELTSAVNGGIDFEAPLGEMYRLAGEVEQATLHLTNASNACVALDYPFQHVWSWYRLGQLRESVGDTAAACAAYGAVLAKWGRAVASRTVLSTRGATRRLRCSN